MAARLCPYCRELNSVGEKRCFRCGRRLPGPAAGGLLRFVQEALGAEAPVTRLLLFLELLVFALCPVVEMSLGHGFPLGDLGPLLGRFGGQGSFSTSTLLRFGALGGDLGRTEPWRLLSAVFVHASFFHIAMNLWVFTVLGRDLERALGSARFALLFLLTGVLGFVVSEWWYAPFHPVTMGASGAVFGEIGAGVGILRARRDREWKSFFWRNLIYALLLSVVMGNVNTAAHLGGFAAGIALGFVFGRERPWARLKTALAVAATAGLVAVVASVGLSMHSLAWQEVRARELRYE
jgi:membrane associated rhomboid family serine protease